MQRVGVSTGCVPGGGPAASGVPQPGVSVTCRDRGPTHSVVPLHLSLPSSLPEYGGRRKVYPSWVSGTQGIRGGVGVPEDDWYKCCKWEVVKRVWDS